MLFWASITKLPNRIVLHALFCAHARSLDLLSIFNDST